MALNKFGCECDDGIGQFVCKLHSTPENDPFHYVFYGEDKDDIEEPEEDDQSTMDRRTSR